MGSFGVDRVLWGGLGSSHMVPQTALAAGKSVEGAFGPGIIQESGGEVVAGAFDPMLGSGATGGGTGISAGFGEVVNAVGLGVGGATAGGWDPANHSFSPVGSGLEEERSGESTVGSAGRVVAGEGGADFGGSGATDGLDVAEGAEEAEGVTSGGLVPANHSSNPEGAGLGKDRPERPAGATGAGGEAAGGSTGLTCDVGVANHASSAEGSGLATERPERPDVPEVGWIGVGLGVSGGVAGVFGSNQTKGLVSIGFWVGTDVGDGGLMGGSS